MLILLLSIWMVRGLLYAFVNPPLESPDESSHLEYVTSYYESGGTRVAGAESHQPPLYYLTTLPFYALVASQPPTVGLLAMRLVSILMGAGTLVLAYLIARRLRPDQPIVYLGTAAFVALVPKFGHISASANNDNLANLLSAAIIWLLLVSIQLGLTPLRVLGMAVLAGLALATKTTTWPVIAVAAVFVAATGLRWSFNRDRAATVLGVALLSLLAAILPAYPSSSSVVQLASGLLGAGFFDQDRAMTFVTNLDAWPFIFQFKTFWATFRNDSIQLPSAVIWILMAITAVAVGGLGLRLLRTARKGLRAVATSCGDRRLGMPLLAIGTMIVLQWMLVFVRFYREKPFTIMERIATAGWDPHFSLLLGRFLFPVMVPIAFFFVWGLMTFVPARWGRPALVALVALLLLVDWIALGSLLFSYYSWET